MNMDEILDGISKAAEQSIPLVEGDYIGTDGLYYCGKCNTKKQCRVINPFNGNEDVRHCLCKCEAERIKQEEAERERIKFMERVSRLRRAGFPDEEMQKWTFSNDDHENEKLSAIAKKYVDNFDTMRKDGKGLLLYGQVGVGKTFISSCIANALIDKGIPCLVTNFSRLTNTISGMFEGKQEYLDRLNRFPLLVIDDLASERDTEYMGEIVQNIIDSRCRAGLPLIITTNLTGEELQNPADMRKQRIYSRLYEMCIPVKCDGRDRRRRKMQDAVKEYSDLLGL